MTLRGFGLRIRDGGSRTWIYRYRIGHVQRSVKLGNASSVPLAIARKNAAQLEAEVRLGGDPAGKKELAKQEAENTFASSAENFLDARKPEVRPSTIVEYERHLRRDCKSLHRLPITAVTQADIARLLRATTGGPATINRLRATLSAMFVWLLKEGVTLPHGNPAAYTHKRVETARDRVLSDAELRSVWNAVGNDDFGRILKLLALTGQRASEIAELRWGEVIGGSIVFSPERTKNHHPHAVPLSDIAKQILPGTGHPFLAVTTPGFLGFPKPRGG